MCSFIIFKTRVRRIQDGHQVWRRYISTTPLRTNLFISKSVFTRTDLTMKNLKHTKFTGMFSHFYKYPLNSLNVQNSIDVPIKALRVYCS